MALSISDSLSFQNVNVISYLKERLIRTYIDSPGRSDNGRRMTKDRQEVVETLLRSSSSENISSVLQNVKEYLNELVQGYRNAGYEQLIDIGLKLKSRLLVGTSTTYLKGLFEIGLSWDPYLNIPYMPATGIKGVLRFSAEQLSLCREMFGNKEAIGEIVILDSYPIECERRLIDADIINPHYREVDRKIKEIDVSPMPIIFLTIAPGVTFRFVVMKRKGLRGCNVSDVMKVLEYALRVGFGAKTSLAYGRFVMVDLV